MDVSIRIAGAAGQGMQTAAELLGARLRKLGFTHSFTRTSKAASAAASIFRNCAFPTPLWLRHRPAWTCFWHSRRKACARSLCRLPTMAVCFRLLPSKA